MTHLIGMTEFVLEQERINGGFGIEEADKIWQYVKFLSKKLEIWMFVPCKLVDGVLVVLEEPKNWENFVEYSGVEVKGLKPELYEYAEAKERCLFEGFELIVKPNGNRYIQKNETIIFYNTENDNGIWRINRKFKTIEDLVKYNLELTATALKQIGL